MNQISAVFTYVSTVYQTALILFVSLYQTRCYHEPPLVLSFKCLTCRTWPEVGCLWWIFLQLPFVFMSWHCLLHGGLLCAFIAIFREYCFNVKEVIQGQTEMHRAQLTPMPLLLLCLCLSFFVCHSYSVVFHSLSLRRLTPLNSILPYSLIHFLLASPFTFPLSFLPPTPLFCPLHFSQSFPPTFQFNQATFIPFVFPVCRFTVDRLLSGRGHS